MREYSVEIGRGGRVGVEGVFGRMKGFLGPGWTRILLVIHFYPLTDDHEYAFST